MIDGISGVPLPEGFPYKVIIEKACAVDNLQPCLVGAIKMNETGLGQGPFTEKNVSGDGGHGIMQLTSSYPSDWSDPEANIGYAVAHFIVPAYEYWKATLQGDDLIRAVAATYNAGMGNALAGHRHGNIDEYTTNHYAARCLAHFQNLIDGKAA